MNQTATQSHHPHGEEDRPAGLPTVEDDEVDLEAFMAELDATYAAIEARKLSADTSTALRPEITLAALVDADSVIEAQQVITKAKEAAKAVSEESVQTIAEPIELVTQASSGADANTISTPTAAPAAPSPTLIPKETAEDLVNDYYFPNNEITDDPSVYHVALMDELESLAQQVRKPDDYLGIRDRYCEISEKLNLRGLWAPAFRPRLTIPLKKDDRLPAHTLILRDRIVIDCHWIHSKGYKIHLGERHWRPLFKIATPFPFVLAVEFSTRWQRNEYRAEGVLGLTPFQQFQTQSLIGVSVQGHIKAVENSQYVDRKRIPPPMEIINLAINRWRERDPRVEREREKYLAHAKARALLEIESPTWREIAILAGLIQGVPPLSESTVRGFMAKLDSRLAKSASR